MADIAEALNSSCFAFLALSHEPGGAPELISTYPPSPERHIICVAAMKSFDPVVRRAISNTQPLRWVFGLDREFGRNPSENFLKRPPASGFGMDSGFQFTTAKVRLRRIDFDRSKNKNAQVLQVMATLFHAHAKRMFGSDRVSIASCCRLVSSKVSNSLPAANPLGISGIFSTNGYVSFGQCPSKARYSHDSASSRAVR